VPANEALAGIVHPSSAAALLIAGSLRGGQVGADTFGQQFTALGVEVELARKDQYVPGLALAIEAELGAIHEADAGHARACRRIRSLRAGLVALFSGSSGK
jgi:hypothetical protein